jgi:hypothetical protein
LRLALLHSITASPPASPSTASTNSDPRLLSHFPGSRADIEAVLRAEHAREVDAAMEHLMTSDPTVRWAITNGMYVMVVDSPRAFAACYLDYALAGGVAEQITDGIAIAPPTRSRRGRCIEQERKGSDRGDEPRLPMRVLLPETR